MASAKSDRWSTSFRRRGGFSTALTGQRRERFTLLLDSIPYIVTLVVLIAWGGTRKHAAPAGLGRVYRGSE